MRISDWSSDVCSSDLDNVVPQAYPPLFISGGLNDPRVTYWEPAKWAARLRATKTDDNLLLLKTNMGAGHGGKSGRFESFREAAEQQPFVLWQLSVESYASPPADGAGRGGGSGARDIQCAGAGGARKMGGEAQGGGTGLRAP